MYIRGIKVRKENNRKNQRKIKQYTHNIIKRNIGVYQKNPDAKGRLRYQVPELVLPLCFLIDI